MHLSTISLTHTESPVRHRSDVIQVRIHIEVRRSGSCNNSTTTRERTKMSVFSFSKQTLGMKCESIQQSQITALSRQQQYEYESITGRSLKACLHRHAPLGAPRGPKGALTYTPTRGALKGPLKGRYKVRSKLFSPHRENKMDSHGGRD